MNEGSYSRKGEKPVGALGLHTGIGLPSVLTIEARMPFDDMERTDPTPARHLEDHFTFLNRVATPFFEQVRVLLGDWVRRLPGETRPDIVGRMRSGDDRQFLGAFWETYLYVTFEQLGLGVECHPAVEGTDRRPDFRLYTADGSFLVEATVATTSDTERSRDRRRGQIYDTLNRSVDTRNFRLGLDLVAEGGASPSIRRSVLRIQDWLDGLDADRAMELMKAERYADLDRLRIEDRGWVFVITAFPRSKETRGLPEDAIAVYPSEIGSFDGREPIAAALEEKKASRYGAIDEPFVIALMQQTFLSGKEDIEHALFGRLMIQVRIDRPGQPTMVRGMDGFWLGPDGPRNQNVSAVVAAQNLYAWSVAKKAPDMWCNPWAQKQAALNVPSWPTITVNDEGELDDSEAAMAPNELFDLDPGWPGAESEFSRLKR